jgi:UDP-glucose 4-epimerase
MKRVLITGGAGFIGTHLSRRLIREGWQVRSIDVAHPLSPIPGVEYLKGDISDENSVRKALAGIEAVFHLAALVSVPLCQEKPLQSYEINFLGTCRLLESIRTLGRPVRLLFASSCAVYGGAGVLGEGLREDMPLVAPTSVYAAQKLASEQAIRLFHQAYAISAVVFRFFNVFGPGQSTESSYSGVISIFLDRLKKRQPLELHGGGEQTRDFISVSEVVRACVRGLTLSENLCDGSPINIGSGRAVTVSEIALRLSEITQIEVPWLSVPARSADIRHSLADVQRAEAVLGWKPSKTLKAGLEELGRHDDKAMENTREINL